MKKYCLALDLKDDPKLIQEYIIHHENVWPEIIKSIKNAGIENVELFLFGNRMVMTIEANDYFSFDKKAEMDANNPRVQEWEELMWKYQQAIPGAKPGEKWVLMEKIFDMNQ